MTTRITEKKAQKYADSIRAFGKARDLDKNGQQAVQAVWLEIQAEYGEDGIEQVTNALHAEAEGRFYEYVYGEMV